MQKKVQELLDTIEFAAEEMQNLVRELRQAMDSASDLEKMKIERRLRRALPVEQHASNS